MAEGLTLREIARLAKVSTATASRAINRIPTVNPILVRRIRKVIEKEGYFPNTNARALVRAFRWGRRRIVSNPDVLGGEPVFRGTRIPLQHVASLFGRVFQRRKLQRISLL